jgi:DNA transposition AAA+ family ATPase
MNNLHEKFSSVDLLNYLFVKINMLFSAQQYVIVALERALKRSAMIGVIGREGMGKSSAIAKFIRANPNVYYVRIGQSYRISNFIDEMLFQVSGVYPKAPDTLFTKMKQLSNLLSKDSTKKLIIVDDAGKLSPRGLGFFHELRDNTIHCTGFVFVGLPYFQKHLLQAKNLGVTGVAEFYRRIESWYTVTGLKKNEVAEYAFKHGLNEDQVLELHQSGIETIAELEWVTHDILEEAEEAKKENRTVRKIGKPGKPVTVSEDDDEDLEDDLEEIEMENRKKKRKKTTKPVSSV